MPCLNSIPLHAAMWALFLVAFFTFLRKSNLIPDNPRQISPKVITRANLVFTPLGANIHEDYPVSATLSHFAHPHDPWVSSLSNFSFTTSFSYQPRSSVCSSFFSFLGVGFRTHDLEAILCFSFARHVSAPFRSVAIFCDIRF